MSTALVAKRKWYQALAILAFVLGGGALLVVALEAGSANPPRENRVLLELAQAPPAAQVLDGMSFSRVSMMPPPPFTLEVSATMTGPAEWGIWLGALPLAQWRFLIDEQGYIALGLSHSLAWRQFIHARHDTNLLYLHVDSANLVTYRVNEEIVWTGSISETLREWGLVTTDGANVQRSRIRVYTN